MKFTGDRFDAIATPMLLLALGAALVGLWGWAGWMAGGSVIHWLKTGVWSHPTIQSALELLGLEFGRSSWVVIQAIWAWCLNLPASLVLAGLAVWLGSVLREAESEFAADHRKLQKGDPRADPRRDGPAD